MYLFFMFDLPVGWLLAVGIVACGMAYVVEMICGEESK